ncbi:aspartic proteinase Asp1-like [Triticum dicoccoides]|uniref:aspartic proteinase Asp1-like n=1 Tax=Triticum dicoccoides TaxID=85692 RepID=UPI00188E98A1|nr:aspartic proteinase Asp1-like [Triticum dicoccoides]
MAAMWSPIIALLLLLLPLVPSSSSAITLPLHGNVYPVGHYYVTLQIGKPLKHYFLDIHTGSNLTWLECQHPHLGCQHCTQGHKHSYYSPKLSNLKVGCQHMYCVALRKDLPGINPQCPIKEPHQCHYKIRYLDGTTEGVLSLDKISVGGKENNIALGCGYNQHPRKPSPVHGILGLGMGTVGFVPQLKLQKMISKNIIGHCLGKDGGGYLFFGDKQFGSEGITWAPMRRYELFYSPGQAKLHLDGQPEPIYKHGVNAVFDSGSTYTYIPARIYNPFVHTVRHMIGSSHREVHDHDLPHCWKFKSIDEVKRLFKPLSLQFDNKIAMHIPAMNYLIHTRSNNWCLAILNGTHVGEDRRILIGDATMRDMLVIYDNQDGRLGWVHQQECTRPHPASRL